jgi:phage anti-repressor protein
MKTVTINKTKVRIFEEQELKEKLKLSENEIGLILKYQRTFPELLQDVKEFAINAETLWEQLGKPQGEFKKWFNRKIEGKFIENSDFTSTDKLVDIEKTNLKRSKLVVYMTVETAKHLAMSTGMDNNSSEEVKNIGRMVRDYFIIMERTLRDYETWINVREPEKQGFNEMKQCIANWCDRSGYDKTIELFYSREADMLNICVSGMKAQDIKAYIGFKDRITREHLETERNKALAEMQLLNIHLLNANMSFEDRTNIIKQACDSKYSNLKLVA